MPSAQVPPDISTVCIYIIHLDCHFSSTHSICNYVSRVRTLHKEMGLTPPTLESFHVSSLFWAANISMRMPPLQCLPILPPLLRRLCSITSSRGSLSSALWVCLTFGSFAMLRQSNLVPLSAAQFDPSRHTCRGTSSWLLQALRSWFGGPRPTSQ